ncbi:hypothetical protein [Streptomyces sp. NPDC005953]|uniref:hypothetical protein n=1 Tax=Streptomyces sp. NPDC005953 TaxID=3156719 RepID=UPI0033ECD5AA
MTPSTDTATVDEIDEVARRLLAPVLAPGPHQFRADLIGDSWPATAATLALLLNNIVSDAIVRGHTHDEGSSGCSPATCTLLAALLLVRELAGRPT